MVAALWQFVLAGLAGVAGLVAVWVLPGSNLVQALGLGAGAAAAVPLAALVLQSAWAWRAGARDGGQRPAPVAWLRAAASEACIAARVFAWQQPFASRRVTDGLDGDSAGRQGALLVHGFVCNRGLWIRPMRALRAAGIPFAAIDLEPPFGPIDDYVLQIEHAVRRVAQATGHPPIVVAHSMGGLAVRAWMRALEGAETRVAAVVTIGTPHQGTELAAWGHATNARQMRRASAWLQDLAGAESSARRSLFTCYASDCDNIVFPPSAAALPGADNRRVASACGHVDLVEDQAIWDDILARLQRPAA